MTGFLGYVHSPKWFNISKEINNVKQLKYNRVNSKRLFNKSIVQRGYCTSSASGNIEISERLKITIKELG